MVEVQDRCFLKGLLPEALQAPVPGGTPRKLEGGQPQHLPQVVHSPLGAVKKRTVIFRVN